MLEIIFRIANFVYIIISFKNLNAGFWVSKWNNQNKK
jgi:hypothetical protein